MEEILNQLLIKIPWLIYLLTGIGALVVIVQAYIAITPTQKDDVWWAKIESIPFIGMLIQFFLRFAPFQRNRGETKERSTDK